MVRPVGGATHTEVNLPVSRKAYEEIHELLEQAGYDHLLHLKGRISMTGVMLTVIEGTPKGEPDQFCKTTADGGCESEHPLDMHAPLPDGVEYGVVEIRMPTAMAQLISKLKPEEIEIILREGTRHLGNNEDEPKAGDTTDQHPT